MEFNNLFSILQVNAIIVSLRADKGRVPYGEHKMKQRLHLCAGEIVVSPCTSAFQINIKQR